jgi:hypothetical protein
MVISGPIPRITGHFTEVIWRSEGFITEIISGGTISTDKALALDISHLPTDQEDFTAAGVTEAEVTEVAGGRDIEQGL